MINNLPLYQSCKVVEGTDEDEDKDDGEWITVQKKHEWKTCGKRLQNKKQIYCTCPERTFL